MVKKRDQQAFLQQESEQSNQKANPVSELENLNVKLFASSNSAWNKKLSGQTVKNTPLTG